MKTRILTTLAGIVLMSTMAQAQYYHSINTPYNSYEQGSSFTATIGVANDGAASNVVVIDASMGHESPDRQGFDPTKFDSATTGGTGYSWDLFPYGGGNVATVVLAKGVVKYSASWMPPGALNAKGISNVNATPKTVYTLTLHVNQAAATGATTLAFDPVVGGGGVDTGSYWLNSSAAAAYNGTLTLQNKALTVVAGAAPTGFGGVTGVANPNIGNTLNLTWTALPNDRTNDLTPPIYYNVYCDTTPGFVPAAGNRVASNVAIGSNTHGPNSGIPGVGAIPAAGAQKLIDGTTYYYKVRAHDSCTPTYNEETNVVELSGTPHDTTPPSPITGLGAVSGDTTLNVSWTNPTAPDFDKVIVIRSTGVANTWTPPANGTAHGLTVGDTAGNGTVLYIGNGTSLPQTGLVNGTRYYYLVVGYDVDNAEQDGYNYSTLVESWFAPGIPPSPPNPFTALPGDERIYLSWTNPNESYFTGTMIRVSTTDYPSSITDGELVTDEAGFPGSSEGYVHYGLINGVKYYYSAFAHNEVPNYSVRATAWATPELDVIPPASVRWFYSLSPASEVVLTWINPTDLDFYGTIVIRKKGGYPTYLPATGEALVPGQEVSPGEFVIYNASTESYVDPSVVLGDIWYYKAYSYDWPRRNYAYPDLTAIRVGATSGGGGTTDDTNLGDGGTGEGSVNFIDEAGVGVTYCSLGSGLYVMVVSAADNLNPAAIESITVTVKNASNTDEEDLVLQETSANSGVFRNTASMEVRYSGAVAGSVRNNYVEARADDVVRAYYKGRYGGVRIIPMAVDNRPAGEYSVAYPDIANPNNYVIRYKLIADTDVMLIIFNLKGEMIWRKAYNSGDNGGRASRENMVYWNLIDDFKRSVDNGVYIFKVVQRSDNKILVGGKVLVLR